MSRPRKCLQCGEPLTRGLKDFAHELATMHDEARKEAEQLAKEKVPDWGPERQARFVEGACESRLEMKSLSLAAEMEGRCQGCAASVGLTKVLERQRREHV